MLDESCSQGDSLLHRTDPRVRLLTATALSLTLALSHSFAAAGLGLALGLLLVCLARLPLALVLRRLLPVNAFLLFLWLLLPFTAGEPLLRIGPLTVTAGGLLLAALVTLKANAILLLLLSLLATTHAAALGHGLEALGVPSRLGHLLLFCYRYIFVLQQEFQRLHCAARLRGFRPANRLHCYRTYGWLLGMTLVRGWNRAQRVRHAMALRGFTGQLISPWELRATAADRWLLTGLLAAAAGLGWLGWVAGR